MSIVRTRREANFTVIPNEVINDADLMGDELGLLVFLLSKPSDWWVTIDALASVVRFGKRNKVNDALKKFRELGYAELKRFRSGKTEWIISDSRVTPASMPHLEKPDVEKPDLANQHAYKEQISTKKIEEQNSLFDLFWKAYPKKASKPDAIRAFKKLNIKTQEDLAPILEGLEKHKASEQWIRQIIPHPSTFLNGRRWEDEFEVIPQSTSNRRINYFS